MKHSLIYVGVFLLYQTLIAALVTVVMKFIFPEMTADMAVTKLVVISGISSLATLATFYFAKWCPISCDYIKTKPYKTLFWTIILSIALILPAVWVQELLPEDYTQDVLADVMEKLLTRPDGYLLVGIFAPAVEEVVFRGAILRKLLEWMKDNFGELTLANRWIAIVISSVFFATVHFNPAQIPHAFLVGLLLGWMYYRTGSIIPGLIYHFINNTAAFLLVWVFPNVSTNAKLIEYFDGDKSAMLMAVGISVMIAIPCLWQLNRLMKR